jgi:hypothetical protein
MKNLFLVLFTSLFIFACKDKNPGPEETKSPLEYLTGGSSTKWTVTAGTVKLGDQEIQLLSNQPPCVTDNILVLKNDFTYELLEGPTKCQPNSPDVIIKSNWKLNENPLSISIDKFIFLDREINNAVFKISSISSETFIGETEVELLGVKYLATITFKAIN